MSFYYLHFAEGHILNQVGYIVSKIIFVHLLNRN